MTTDRKILALAQFLDVQPDCIERPRGNVYTLENSDQEYLVLTERGADLEARAQIRNDLWAFKASFIVAHSKIKNDSPRVTVALIEAIHAMQGKLCEDANELVYALIEDFDAFADEAIKADGRGHFLSSYDGEEWEVRVDGETLYIYRVN